MYVDPSDLTRTMEQEVNEATAALKGILGIGSTVQKETPARDESELDSSSRPSKKKNNKKKKNYDQHQRYHKQSNHGSRQHSAPREGRSNNVGPNSKKTKKKNKKKDGKDSNNFAWSAFQSSPDASKLPIPAFASPTNHGKELVTLNSSEPFSVLLAASGEGETDAPEVENALRAEEVEGLVIAEAKKQADKAASAASTVDGETTAKAENKIKKGSLDETESADKTHSVHKAKEGDVVIENRTATPPKDESPSDAPVSRTGVNLAELASRSAKADPVPEPSPATSSVGGASQRPLPHPNRMPLHSSGPVLNYPHPGFAAPHQYPPPPPPGYVTIQVQVPPVLMPGRQMMVTSPAGYPVRVVVPEGIPPGMVIPVHVPAGPPLHMMPMSAPSPYHGSYYHPR